MNLNVVEIFDSIEGEGIRAGMPVTFIRLAGCNLECSYCDTPYSHKKEDGELMSIENILKKINYNNVTLTGGEPLLHKTRALALIENLVNKDYEVNVETNGSIDITPFILPLRRGNGFFTIDYKCPSSGMYKKMKKDNFNLLNERDVIKFVVSDSTDLDYVKGFLTTFKKFSGKIYISPVFGKIELPYLAEEVKEIKKTYPKYDIRMQLQLHKFIWNPEERGV